jgi:thymidylate synthase ThyX
MTKAKIIADSISEQSIRITTLELEFPRFLLAQFNTHRMFSRSAQSSRAVPVKDMISRIKSNGFVPNFMKNKAGMQADELFAFYEQKDFESHWVKVQDAAISAARIFIAGNVHKQFANRLLEPFATVKVVVTATEWDNFFDLRLHHAAQPEMQELAQAMKTAMDESIPHKLDSTLWHLPYVSHDEYTGIGTTFLDLALISAARCARVSYLNHDNSTPDIEKDLLLAQRLLADKHLSPFEHQAKPIYLPIHSTQSPICLDDSFLDGVTHIDKCGVEWSGNFKGWIQHRHLC